MKKSFAWGIILTILMGCEIAPAATKPESRWLLIDNFEPDTALQNWTLFDAQNETDPFIANPQISQIRKEDGINNRYMLRKPAADGIIGNRKALAWKTLPRPVAVGQTATFYTRINVESFPNNHSFGISNQPADQIGVLAYDAFEPMIRITDKAESNGLKNDGTLMVLIGQKKYSKINNPDTGMAASPLTPNQWYELWYVVDNSIRDDGGQTYKLYVRGGEFTQQTLVYENAKFRIGREQALITFMSICNTGPKRSPYGNGGVRYDDIYMAHGENLNSPLNNN